MPADNDKTGIPFDAPGVRYERLTETLAILKALFGPDESVTFTGKHYQVKDLTAWPKPAQKHVPLMLGARGPRMLRLAAREADIIGIMGGGGADHAAQLQIVREAAGERFDQIEFNALYLQVQVDGQPESAAPSNLPGLVGSRDQIIEKLLADREQYLVSYVAVIGTAIDAFAPIVARLAGN
jgi:alkanesulfonate monooxygenase SsuD/methylene tetrahydromethanopterin reductase-like flavin-dependent oxidoreductase (luciferase family)